jgi:hypothetical protein
MIHDEIKKYRIFSDGLQQRRKVEYYANRV